uniref:Uncharacterized protein n=1 Tax=Arundo donax TaxID=35708 RepID=A0A0A9FIC7_ARUDO
MSTLQPTEGHHSVPGAAESQPYRVLLVELCLLRSPEHAGTRTPEFHWLKLHQFEDIHWNRRQHPLHRRCCKFVNKPRPLHPLHCHHPMTGHPQPFEVTSRPVFPWQTSFVQVMNSTSRSCLADLRYDASTPPAFGALQSVLMLVSLLTDFEAS